MKCLNLKKILLWVLCALGTSVLITLVFKAFNGDTINPLYAVGSIDETGEVEESEVSIYTKNAFEFEVLTVDWDDEKTGSYQLFYYDEDDEFVSASEIYSGDNEIEMVEGATQARLVITPVLEEKDEINFFEIIKYSNYAKLTHEAVKEDK